MDLSDDFRDGFVDSLRLDAPEQTRFAAERAERSSGNFTVFQNGVYTACEPCKDDPKKPPKWQVKAARIIHDQGEKMMYFEDARLEFFGVPLAYLPYLSAPDPTVKRKTGVLMPSYSTSSVYGLGVSVPYYWALAPDYDADLHADDHDQAGPAAAGRVAPTAAQRRLQHPRHGPLPARQGAVCKHARLIATGAAASKRRASSIFRTSGSGAGTGRCCPTRPISRTTASSETSQTSNLLTFVTPDYMLSQLYLAGRGDRSYFDARAMYFYGLSRSDIQSQLPVVHPVIDHDYVFKNPIFGGELSFHNNLTSLSRDTASFDPISQAAVNGSLCASDHRRSRAQEREQLPAARRSRHLHPALHPTGIGNARSSTRGARCSPRSSPCAPTSPT